MDLDKQDRWCAIDLTGWVIKPVGKATLGELIDSKESGQRWVTFKSKKRPSSGSKERIDRRFDSTITWRDVIGGPTYKCIINEQQITCVVAPAKSDLLFVGSRTNALLGRGYLSCFQKGELLWRFVPEAVGTYPFGVNYPGNTMMDAFPYRVVSSENGHLIAVSFLEHLFVLNANGQLVGRYDGHDLISDAESLDVTTEIDRGDISKTENLNSFGEFDIEVSVEGAGNGGWISCLAVDKAGKAVIAAVRNILVWISPSGQIAEIKRLPIGENNPTGSTGTINGIEIDSTRNAVIASVCGHGFAFVSSGEILPTLHVDFNAWAYNSDHDLLAVKVYGADTVDLYNSKGDVLARVSASPEANSLMISDCGSFFAITGEETMLYRMTWSSENQPEKDLPSVILGPAVASRRGLPAWTVDLKSIGFINRISFSDDGTALLAEFDDCLYVFRNGVLETTISSEGKGYVFYGSQISPDGSKLIAVQSGEKIVGTKYTLYDYRGSAKWSFSTDELDAWIVQDSGTYRTTGSEEIHECFFQPDQQIIFRSVAYHKCRERRGPDGKIKRRFICENKPLIHYRSVSDTDGVKSDSEAKALWENLYWSQPGLHDHPDRIKGYFSDETERSENGDINDSRTQQWIWNGKLLVYSSHGLQCMNRYGGELWSYGNEMPSDFLASGDSSLLLLWYGSSFTVISDCGQVVNNVKSELSRALSVGNDASVLTISRNGEMKHYDANGRMSKKTRVGVLPPREPSAISRGGLCAFVSSHRESSTIVVSDATGEILVKWLSPVPFCNVQWASCAEHCLVTNPDGFVASFRF